MRRALSLSGGSLKGSTLSIEVSKKRGAGGQQGGPSARGGFTSPRGGAHQGGGGGYRGELELLTL